MADRQMRLLFISDLYPPYEVGGYEQWCHEVATHLRLRGHAVSVLTSRYGVAKRLAVDGDEDVARTLRLQSDLDHYQPLRFFVRHSADERTNREEVRKAIHRVRPDVVVVWGMWQLSWNVPHAAELLCPGRVAYYVASYWPTDVDPHTEYWQRPARNEIRQRTKDVLRRLALARLRRGHYPPALRFEHVACCSEFVRKALVRARALPASADVVMGGIEIESASPGAGRVDVREGLPLRLVYFGRLVPDKGVHTAIQAVAMLQTDGAASPVRLTIVGSGHPDYEAQLRRLATEQGADTIVDFRGKVARGHVQAMLSEFDVFLFTSTWDEPFGRTIVEAMQAGLVVVGSDVGGSREIFRHYDDQLLYEPGNASALASRIRQVLADSRMRERLSRRGRELVAERFSMPRMVDGVEAWLDRIASRSQPVS